MRTSTLLFLDWDSTLTITSTVPLLLSISPTAPSISPCDLSALYASDFAAHSSSYTPIASSRTTIPEEIDYLNSLRDVERASIERCEQAGIWRGVTPQVIEGAAEKAIREGSVVLRPGAGRIVEEVLKSGGKVVVLSIGWSAWFTSCCLRAGLGKEAKVVEVRANEIREDGNLNRYFGVDGGGIWTCGDKMRVLSEVIQDEKGMRTVYVGDSVTDLECLTRVNVGICMRGGETGSEQNSLCRTLERLKIECRCFLERKAGDKGNAVAEEVALWWAKDFDEIYEAGILDSR